MQGMQNPKPMKRYRTLLPFLGFALCLAGCGGNSRPADTFRLVTDNVGVFNKYIADDYPLVAEMMKEGGVDADCLNELDSCTTRTGGVFQLERIARLMGGWDYCYGAAMPYRGGSYGEGVMTRDRAVDKFSVPLPQGAGCAKVAVSLTILAHTTGKLHCAVRIPRKACPASNSWLPKVAASYPSRFIRSIIGLRGSAARSL